MSDATIILQIEGSKAEAKTEASAGWEVETFILDGAARGAGVPLPEVKLQADAVLELELANGTRILTAAEDAHHYLGAPVGRGADKTDAITVGQSLRFSGPRLPEGATREGLGAWVIKGLRVFTQGPASMTALIAAGTFQDARLDHRNGLYRCADCGRIIALECVNLPYSDGQIVATAAAAGTVGIATEGWARFPEVRAYASHRGVTVAEAIVALVNSGLSHESRSYV